MIRSAKIVRHLAVRADLVADTITLDHQGRHRRRMALTSDGGLEFLLDLDRAVVMDDGDAIELEDGRLIQVKAAPEELLEVTTFNPLRLLRAAWHLGNRHVPAEITAEALYIRQDPVIESMLRGIGASSKQVVRPFKPERGAYEGTQAHNHRGHGHHDHDHDHDQHGHCEHKHSHGDGHVHDAACGHHAHSHD